MTTAFELTARVVRVAAGILARRPDGHGLAFRRVWELVQEEDPDLEADWHAAFPEVETAVEKRLRYESINLGKVGWLRKTGRQWRLTGPGRMALEESDATGFLSRARSAYGYQRALGLAELIMRGASYELDDGRRVLVDGLLLEMWRVFETFLAAALGEELHRRADGRAEPCDRDHHLDLGKKELLKPDLIHYLPPPDGGRRLVPAIIVDAKYRDGTKRADLYQMFAYCVRLGIAEGHLVSAAGSESRMEVPVADKMIRLHRHVVDLSLPYRDLRTRIGELADTLLRLRARSAAPSL